jgi:hypothetical protein
LSRPITKSTCRPPRFRLAKITAGISCAERNSTERKRVARSDACTMGSPMNISMDANRDSAAPGGLRVCGPIMHQKSLRYPPEIFGRAPQAGGGRSDRLREQNRFGRKTAVGSERTSARAPPVPLHRSCKYNITREEMLSRLNAAATYSLIRSTSSCVSRSLVRS